MARESPIRAPFVRGTFLPVNRRDKIRLILQLFGAREGADEAGGGAAST